ARTPQGLAMESDAQISPFSACTLQVGHFSLGTWRHVERLCPWPNVFGHGIGEKRGRDSYRYESRPLFSPFSPLFSPFSPLTPSAACGGPATAAVSGWRPSPLTAELRAAWRGPEARQGGDTS